MLPLEEREERDRGDRGKREQRRGGDRDRTTAPSSFERELALRLECAAPSEHPFGENVVEDLVAPVSRPPALLSTGTDDALGDEMAEDVRYSCSPARA